MQSRVLAFIETEERKNRPAFLFGKNHLELVGCFLDGAFTAV